MTSISAMPVAVDIAEGPYQPYQCQVCQSRFTRHENLKRHAALHSRSSQGSSLPCGLCHATFSRPDLRNRHVKKKHPQYQEKIARERRPRDSRCRRSSHEASPSGMDLPEPGQNDVELEHNIHFESEHVDDRRSVDSITTPSTSEEGNSPALPRSMDYSNSLTESTCYETSVPDVTDLEPNLLSSCLEPAHFSTALDPTTMAQLASFTDMSGYSLNLGKSPSIGVSPGREWSPNELQIETGCMLFFRHISHFLPFLHQPTFEPAHAPRYLLLSMLCLGYQHGDDPCDQAGSGVALSERCFRQARVTIAQEEERTDDAAHNLAIVQAYLLLQIAAMMYICGEDSVYGLKKHSKIISLTRAGGLVHPFSTAFTSTQDLESLWREFVKAESRKRTLFAVHQIDALWYQFLSIPRSLSHLEIKHDLPCPPDFWSASSAGEWAHRRLTCQRSGTPMQYSDAVRRFLSSDADPHCMPPFDPYGTINVTQFLVSSAREISGWSTMTGMLSMERLEPLRSSLIALDPFIRSQTASPNSALCEATWESAMIELQMWSPSHTGGIVEGSIDAVLHQLTSLGPCCEFLPESNTAKIIQPHVDWFLRYLDSTIVPDLEAPWITVYAYKAFMIAWQLLRGNIPGALQAVGVEDGDVQGALAWARKVFWRRQRWQLGKIIMTCLDSLEVGCGGGDR